MKRSRFSPLLFLAGMPPQADTLSTVSVSSTMSAMAASSTSAVMDSRAVEWATSRCRCWNEPSRRRVPKLTKRMM